ncbi:hypothetical protein IR073_06515 [Gemella sp. 19428wG2_WT2a]|nr:hypothetical protein [Gemella sp. 19428wG2_WT2a]TFU57689.1 hypothetical protein E4T67_06440 [Gemella sp. WT2a]
MKKAPFKFDDFEQNYVYKGFDEKQFIEISNKYRGFVGSHVSKDNNNAVIKLDKSNVFKTSYGYAVKIDNEHTVFIKNWQIWGETPESYTINFNRQYFKVKKWGDYSDMSEGGWRSFDDVIKTAKKQEKYYEKSYKRQKEFKF